MRTAIKTPKLDLRNPFFDQAARAELERAARAKTHDASTWRIESARRELAAAFASAHERGVVRPTGFIAHADQFLGLAFARELIGERGMRGRIDTSRPLIGCESQNVIACILLAVAPSGCGDLLERDGGDPRGHAPVVVLDRTIRVAHVDVGELLAVRQRLQASDLSL